MLRGTVCRPTGTTVLEIQYLKYTVASYHCVYHDIAQCMPLNNTFTHVCRPATIFAASDSISSTVWYQMFHYGPDRAMPHASLTCTMNNGSMHRLTLAKDKRELKQLIGWLQPHGLL